MMSVTMGDVSIEARLASGLYECLVVSRFSVIRSSSVAIIIFDRRTQLIGSLKCAVLSIMLAGA